MYYIIRVVMVGRVFQIMKLVFTVILIIALSGCDSDSQPDMSIYDRPLNIKNIRQQNDVTEQLQFLCRHEALFVALVARYQGLGCEIWHGKYDGVSHTQTKVFVDDEWRWVRIYDGMFRYFYDDFEHHFKPSRSFKIDEYWYLVRFWDK
jgi:hypothetical protein